MDCQSDRVAGSRRRTGRRLLFVVALAATALALGRVSMKADGLGWAMFYRATEDPNFSFDYGYSIRPIPGGGFMMAGVTAYPGDPAITKLDANGNTIWTKAYRNTLSEDIYTQWLTDDGGVIAAGLVRRQPCCEMDMLVMKVASDGALQWSKTYALQGNERATHIQQVGSKYIVVGETFSSKEGTRAWVLTLRADGSVERQIAYGKKKKVNTAYYGLPLSDGGLLAVGTTTETGKSQSSELWLFKLNPDGSLAWQKAYPAKGSQNGVHLHPTPDGGAIVLSRGAPDDQWHLRNAWALKINAQGDTTGGGWQRAFGFPTAYAEVTGTRCIRSRITRCLTDRRWKPDTFWRARRMTAAGRAMARRSSWRTFSPTATSNGSARPISARGVASLSMKSRWWAATGSWSRGRWVAAFHPGSRPSRDSCNTPFRGSRFACR